MELKRANRIVINSDVDGTICDGKGFKADFYKTHKHVATIRSEQIDADWLTMDADNKDYTASQRREDFRKYVIEHASDYGVEWNPQDLRDETNKRKPKYETDEDLFNDAVAMVADDVDRLIQGMPWADKVSDTDLTCDSVTAMELSPKGTDLSKLGILDGKYANGNWAWANVELTVVIVIDGKEIYQTLNMQLVSGQLKKFQMSQSTWNMEIKKSIDEISAE